MPHSATTPKSSVVQEKPNILPNVVKLLDDAERELDINREAAKVLLARAATIVRIEIVRQAADAVVDNRTGGLAAWQIRRLDVFVESRLGHPIRISELSAVSKLSRSHFSRAFKRTFGETPHSYVIRRRLELAESFMLTSDFSLAEIATRCGLSDQAHLCKLFRGRRDQTPAAWRRERTDHVRRRHDRECRSELRG